MKILLLGIFFFWYILVAYPIFAELLFLMLLFGIVVLVCIQLYNAKKLSKNGILTEGEIVYVIKDKSFENNYSTYWFSYKFLDNKNISHINRSKLGYENRKYKVGEKVLVRYLEEDPSQSSIHKYSMEFRAYLSYIITMFIVILIMFLSLLYRYNFFELRNCIQ